MDGSRPGVIGRVGHLIGALAELVEYLVPSVRRSARGEEVTGAIM